MTENEKAIKVLVIDDDTTLANTLQLYLDNAGYDVDVALDGSGALELARQKSFDILICDYNLPDTKGLDLIKRILEFSSRSVPILLTGTRSMDLALDGMRLGVHDYLVKPIDYDELKKVLSDIVEERKKYLDGKEKLKEITGEQTVRTEEVKTEPVAAGEKTLKLTEEKEQSPGTKQPESAPKSISKGLHPDTSEIFGASDKERTIFDFVLDRVGGVKKKIRNFIIVFCVLTVAFIVLDTVYLQYTNIGKNLHNRIWPPSLVLDSIPSKASVALLDENGNKIIQDLQYAPVTIPKIFPGNYSLKMELKGYNPIERKITVYGELENDGNISIPGQVKNYSDEKTQKYVILFEQSVEIDSDPEGAEIYVDDKKMGMNTPAVVNLTAARHSITLAIEGFDTLGSRSLDNPEGQCVLDITKQTQEEVDQNYWDIKKTDSGYYLKGKFWREVSINSDPAGAQIFADEKKVGSTPFVAKLAYGKHDLKIEKNGYKGWSGSVNVPDQKKIKAVLSKYVELAAYEDGKKGGKDINAAVYVNKIKIKGKTTPFKYAFRPGTHRITFVRHPGYVNWTRYIEVRGISSVIAYMKKEFLDISINISDQNTKQPISAVEIFIDGKKEGSTDVSGVWKGSVKRGSRNIKVKKSGIYEEKTLDQDISEEMKSFEILMAQPQKVSEKEKKVKSKKEILYILIVDTRPQFPGASIYFDGKFKGETAR
ncbi:PEGA domain-containing protein, partial [Elusimicrobiota bacterium]